MNSHKSPVWQPAALNPWLAALKAGEIAAAPAEGVYGYVADPFNPAALAQVLHRKRRGPTKGFILLVANPAQLEHLCPQPLPTDCQDAIARYWPCPPDQAITLVLPALPTLPILLRGNRTTLAVRCPATPYMQEYLAAWGGALVSTSLNVSGEPPATDASQIPPGIPALTLPQRLSGKPSSIFNPATNQWLR